MTQATVNPSPKVRFQAKNGAVEAHHNLLESDHFDRAEDLALLEYNRKLAIRLANEAAPSRQLMAMENANKLAGALEFLSEFRNLAEKPQPVQPPGIARTLNHDAN